jgi:hypothetical protein
VVTAGGTARHLGWHARFVGVVSTAGS